MALNIKDEATDRAVRALAREAGEPITTATRIAAEERLARLRAGRERRTPRASLDAIVARGRVRAARDTRPEDEILGYGQDGLPG